MRKHAHHELLDLPTAESLEGLLEARDTELCHLVLELVDFLLPRAQRHELLESHNIELAEKTPVDLRIQGWTDLVSEN